MGRRSRVWLGGGVVLMRIGAWLGVAGAWIGAFSGVWGLSRHREFWGYVSVKVFLKRLLEN